jgi:hypothetical protein
VHYQILNPHHDAVGANIADQTGCVGLWSAPGKAGIFLGELHQQLQLQSQPPRSQPLSQQQQQQHSNDEMSLDELSLGPQQSEPLQHEPWLLTSIGAIPR